jgi:hypothetical protein
MINELLLRNIKRKKWIKYLYINILFLNKAFKQIGE